MYFSARRNLRKKRHHTTPMPSNYFCDRIDRNELSENLYRRCGVLRKSPQHTAQSGRRFGKPAKFGKVIAQRLCR